MSYFFDFLGGFGVVLFIVFCIVCIIMTIRGLSESGSAKTNYIEVDTSENSRTVNNIKYIMGLAIEGSAEAQCELGTIYFLGEGIPQSFKEAHKWYMKSAEQGLPAAQYNLALMYYSGAGEIQQSYLEANKWYRKAAEQGYTKAQFNLGMSYYEGNGVPQSYGEASKWWLKAAEQGLLDAQHNLGLLYVKGNGVPQSYSEASKWWLKAAEQGLPAAQYNLALMYLEKEMFNIEQAYYWMKKACEGGYLDACKTLKGLKELNNIIES